MEVERRLWRSSLSRGVVLTVRQNTTNGSGLSDESDDLHLGPASAGQRVDVVDFVNELSPRFRTERCVGAGRSSRCFCAESQRRVVEERTRLA